MKIAALINRIETYVDRLADEGEVIMKEECPVGATGELKGSIHKDGTGNWDRTVGPHVYYAKWARYGRGPVKPKGNGYMLRWEEYHGRQSSIHQPGADGYRKAWELPPTRENPFTVETATKLKGKAKSLF